MTGSTLPLPARPGPEPPEASTGQPDTARRKLSIFISHPSDFMTDDQPHGDGLAAYELIRRLAARGHSLHVAVPAQSLSGSLPPGVQLYPIRVRARFSALQPFEYMLRVSRLFRQVHRRHHVDLIHQLNPVNPGLSAGLSCSHVPLVLGLFVSSWPTPLHDAEKRGARVLVMARVITAAGLLALDRFQQRRARALLLSTPAAMSRIHEPALAVRRVHLLPYGVDTQHFTPDSAPASATPEILFIGSLTERKGVLTLLHAFDAVIRRLPGCRLRIAGVGPEEATLRAFVAASPSGASVELLGGVTRPFIPQLLGRCSLLCVPSRGEPFGLVALEAMASGKPVVGTDAGGLGHLISPRGGRKVPPGDAAALASALLEILESPSLAAEMGAFNRALVESSYSWDSVIERLEAIYHESLDSPRRAAP